MDTTDWALAEVLELAVEGRDGGELRFLIEDAPRCIDAIERAGCACIGIDGFIKIDGGHAEPLKWIFDGSPERGSPPDWPTYRDDRNARARQHLVEIENDGAHGCSFVALSEAEWSRSMRRIERDSR